MAASSIVLERGVYFISNDDIVSVLAGGDAPYYYFGRIHTDPRRRNLQIATPDADGIWRIPERIYADSDQPLPPGVGFSAVEAMALHPVFNTLYLAVPLRNSATVDRLLTAYRIGGSGLPLGGPISYPVSGFTWVSSLALHPSRNMLYVGGGIGSSCAVAAFFLDRDVGLPLVEAGGSPLIFQDASHVAAHSLAIDPAGRRLYVATENPAIMALTLDDFGLITGRAGVVDSIGPKRISITLAGNRLYWAQSVTAADPPDGNGPLQYLQLDDNGDLSGAPVTPLVGGAPITVRRPFYPPHLAADPTHHALVFAQETSFVDAFDGSTVTDGTRLVRLDPVSGGLTEISRSYHLAPRSMTVMRGGRPLVVGERVDPPASASRLRGQQLRLTVLDPPSLPNLNITGGAHDLGTRALTGSSTGWLSLDEVLAGVSGLISLKILAPGADAITRLRVRADIAYETSAGTPIVALTRVSESAGPNVFHRQAVRLVIPGYGADPFTLGLPDDTDLEGARRRLTDFYDVYSAAYVEKTRAVAVAPADRARNFVLSASATHGGGQANDTLLRNVLQTLTMLGFNTAVFDDWGAIAIDHLEAVAASYGITRRGVAGPTISLPLGGTERETNPFAFVLNDTAADSIARAWVAGLGPVGPNYYIANLGQIADLVFMDEPHWPYPYTVHLADDATVGAALRSDFVHFLQSQGLTPAQLGATDWTTVRPLDLHDAGANTGPNWSATIPLAQRRLFYWTMRYFPDAHARGAARLRGHMETALSAAPPHIPLTPLFIFDDNTQRWYRPYPPGGSGGAPDMFLGARLRAFHPWMEDPGTSLGDPQMVFPIQQLSYGGDVMRSAALLGDGRFGYFLRGNIQGSKVHETAFRVLALVGKGAKALDFWCWGASLIPEAPISTDGFSQRFIAYEAIAEALRLVGRGGSLLYDGQPRRGQVAILWPGTNHCWDPYPEAYDGELCNREVMRLHFALTHAGFAVDFVDDADIVDGALRGRHYRVLYAASPNLRRAAIAPLEQWVNIDGGTLVITPSALVNDEYDQPLPATLNSLLGLHARTRASWPNTADGDIVTPETHAVSFGESTFAGADPLTARGPLAPLDPVSSSSVVAVSGGRPVITRHAAGAGSAVAFGFFPGHTYLLTPNYHQRFVPTEWGPRERDVTVAPVRLARVTPPVTCSMPGVEICRLESPKGIALVLLNWAGHPIPSLVVQVHDVAAVHALSSAMRGPLSGYHFSPTARLLQFNLPLTAVDVVQIPYA